MRVTLNEEAQTEWHTKNLECLRYEYNLKPTDLVIDIGAYTGEWATQIFARYGCKLIVVEPGPWIIGFQHGEVINKAASTFNGKLKFGGAFYYTSAHEDLTHEYECFDINELLSQHEEIALLKMNVEGAEYDLLPRMFSAGLQKRIRNLQVQFHLIEGQDCHAGYEMIAAELENTHRLEWRYPFVWESWNRNA